MKLKRFVAMGIAAVMSLSLFGCGKEETAVTEVEGELKFDTKLELTMWETQGTDYAKPTEATDDIVGKWLLDKTNVEIKDIYGNGGGQWDTKLSKLIAGGNLPDIVHCGASQGPAHFAKLDELGEVWELTPELLQKYAPNVWKRVPERLWDKMTINGKILGIPYYLNVDETTHPDATPEDIEYIRNYTTTPYNDMMYVFTQCFWIRDDILRSVYPEAKSYDECVALLNEKGEPIGDELLDIPIYTTEEFIDFMYKIKDMGLKENDKTVYAFGYNGGDNWTALSWLGADMYGYKGHYYTGTWNDVKQRMEIPLVGDMIKQAAKTQNQMIADGVIDMESLAHTAAMYNEKVLNGQYAIVPIDLVNSAEQVNAQLESMGKSFRYRPFITQVARPEGYGPFKTESSWGQSLCLMKSLDENEMIQVLNWINVQFSDEYQDVLNWGPKEAGLYTEDENGIRHFVDEKFTKFFIEGDSTAMDIKDTKGLGGVLATRSNVLTDVSISTYSRWTPAVHQRQVALIPTMSSGFQFKADSPHVISVKEYPPCQVWDSIYAEIPEVVTFWSEREQWENDFKLALAANTSEFDSKWQSAIDKLNAKVDIKTMEDKMTEIAKQNMPQ